MGGVSEKTKIESRMLSLKLRRQNIQDEKKRIIKELEQMLKTHIIREPIPDYIDDNRTLKKRKRPLTSTTSSNENRNKKKYKTHIPPSNYSSFFTQSKEIIKTLNYERRNLMNISIQYMNKKNERIESETELSKIFTEINNLTSKFNEQKNNIKVEILNVQQSLENIQKEGKRR